MKEASMNTQRANLGKASLFLFLAAAAGSVLVACNEPEKSKDFSPEADQSADAPAPQAPAGTLASELTYDERKVPLAPGGKCNLERANGHAFSGTPLEVSGSKPLTYVGWVVNSQAGSVPGSADVRFVAGDSRVWRATITTGLARPDVTALLGAQPTFTNPGYSATINISTLPAGVYRSYVVFKDGDELKSCDNGRAISVVE